MGIMFPELDSRCREDLRRRAPRLVNPFIRQSREFGDPAPHINTVRIELGALRGWIKNSKEWRGVGATAGHPLPSQRVAGEIRIHQGVPEPACAMCPVDEQVFDEEGGGNHAHAIVHPTGMPQLAHTGIDNGIARDSAAPRGLRAIIVLPGKLREVGAQGLLWRVWKVIQQVMCEFSPTDFGEKLRGAPRRVSPSLQRVVTRRVPDLARPNVAEVQVRR